MSRVELKGGALTAPLPPALVTVGEGERANVLTVAWTGILATVPPRTYISVRKRRHSHALLSETREFVIHLPSAGLVREVDFCGMYTGAKINKLERCGFTLLPSAEVSAPTIAECPIALECRVSEIREMGSHDVFFADILRVTADESLFDETGKLHIERADLLAYAHGDYYRLGKCVGGFGFSARKKKHGARRGGGGRT
jgi:flavin reductase (DIM6/NTAB) family NADH-FMN oxidoreductase RutF